jgi:hypothetical protein
MKNKFYLLSAAMVIISTAVPFFAMAQDPGGGPDVPIDGGLSILLAAGTAYGVKKYREHKKKGNEAAGQDLK